MTLLPESERLIVDLSTLDRLTPATDFVTPKGKSGGLTVKKRSDGLIEIESRRDTVRIRGDTACSHMTEYNEIKEEQGGSRLSAIVLICILLIAVFLRKNYA